MKAFFIALGLLLHGSLVLAADRLHDIKARGELRVCIWPEYYGSPTAIPSLVRWRG